MGTSPDPRRILAVVPSIRIEGTTARIRRGSGAARGTVWGRVGGIGGQWLGGFGCQAGFGEVARTRGTGPKGQSRGIVQRLM
jgi:hypothetical protein